ncbi:dUTP diphosphatase [Candidatus Gracilibacteria bacterium]|nr:dUTP diphosphatase [Candidatus Gracilibacteria bacterium]
MSKAEGKVKIKRVDTSLPLPQYATSGAVAFDVIARVETVIKPGEVELVPGNVIVEIPKNYMLILACRSSTPIKRGLMSPHGIGIIDQDYCGPADELKVQLYNFTKEAVTVARGERIAQGIFARIDRFEWEEVEEMEKPSRGGFGSTGHHASY